MMMVKEVNFFPLLFILLFSLSKKKTHEFAILVLLALLRHASVVLVVARVAVPRLVGRREARVVRRGLDFDLDSRGVGFLFGGGGIVLDGGDDGVFDRLDGVLDGLDGGGLRWWWFLCGGGEKIAKEGEREREEGISERAREKEGRATKGKRT